MEDPNGEGGTVAAVEAAFGEAFKFVRGGERVRSILATLMHPGEELSLLADEFPEIAPEIVAACESLGEMSEAIGRAFTFLDAQFQVAMERIIAAAEEGS